MWNPSIIAAVPIEGLSCGYKRNEKGKKEKARQR